MSLPLTMFATYTVCLVFLLYQNRGPVAHAERATPAPTAPVASGKAPGRPAPAAPVRQPVTAPTVDPAPEVSAYTGPKAPMQLESPDGGPRLPVIANVVANKFNDKTTGTITNISRESLSITVTVTNPDGQLTHTLPIYLQPRESKHIGSDDGLEAHPGDTVTLTSPNYAARRISLP